MQEPAAKVNLAPRLSVGRTGRRTGILRQRTLPAPFKRLGYWLLAKPHQAGTPPLAAISPCAKRMPSAAVWVAEACPTMVRQLEAKLTMLRASRKPHFTTAT